VDLDGGVAGGVRALRGGDELLDDRVNAVGVQLLRRGVLSRKRKRRRADDQPAPVVWRQRRLRFPATPHAGLSPGMRELDRHRAALLISKAHDTRQRLDLPVVPQAEIARADAPFGGDGGGFTDDQAGAADGARAVMHEMPVVGEAVGRRVLAHGGYADAVAQRDVAQDERFEEVGHGFSGRAGW
jgi:hypothetical protein